jgi:putative phosphoesterase
MTIGVISDTHGLLRPEALQALEGSELIVHAGDVGSPEILKRLRVIARTLAVRGNVDTQPWAQTLPLTEVVAGGSATLCTCCTIWRRSIWIQRPLDLPP